MKVDQVRDSVNCRVDEVRYFVKIVDVVRVDEVRVDQVGCSPNRPQDMIIPLRTVDTAPVHQTNSVPCYTDTIPYSAEYTRLPK